MMALDPRGLPIFANKTAQRKWRPLPGKRHLQNTKSKRFVPQRGEQRNGGQHG